MDAIMNLKKYAGAKGRSGSLAQFQSLIALFLLCLAISLLSDKFFTVANGWNVLRQISVNICISVGMTLVVLTAGIDLSVGSVLALCGALTAGLLKNGIEDINTEDPADIDVAKNDLIEMVNTVDPRFSINGAYAKLPQGVFDVHQAWSGDMIGAQYYTGNGITPEDLGYWFPEQGGGVINNDLMSIPSTAKNPVLAHLFLDFTLDAKHGLENFSWVGYQPPLKSMEADTLVADGYVPESVENAVVLQEQFDTNIRGLALSPQGDELWLAAWEEISSGASTGDN